MGLLWQARAAEVSAAVGAAEEVETMGESAVQVDHAATAASTNGVAAAALDDYIETPREYRVQLDANKNQKPFSPFGN